MLIRIEYESSWRNSFLSGNNNESIPDGGRKYIASGEGLKKSENYILRKVEKSTVMGILNRLIGDQRKLYQAREDKEYYFKKIETLISYKDIPKDISNELVYLRNMSGNFDKKLFTGAINIKHPLLVSNYSYDLWSILDLNLNELIAFILSNKCNKTTNKELMNPLLVEDKVAKFKDIKFDKLDSEISKEDIFKVIDFFQKNIALNEELKIRFPKLRKTFSDIEYIKDKKLIVRALYCSSLYLQAILLSEKYEMKDVFLKGFSVNGFTPKDFMSLFTGGKKIVYGNPYFAEKYEKGIGKTTSMLRKVNGTLEITLKIDEDKADELEELIDNAGVSSFYLGKKGLAYVTYIDTREED